MEVDFKIVNAIYEMLAPLIRLHGVEREQIEKFVYYLLIIASAIGEELGIPLEEFLALGRSAYCSGKSDVLN